MVEAVEQAQLLANQLRRHPEDMAARRRLDRLIRQHPDMPAVRFERAALLQEQHALEAAVIDWDRGLALAPEASLAWRFLAEAHLALEQPDRAVTAAERVLALEPDDVPAQILLGAAQLAAGATITARATLAAAEHLDPLHPLTARHLADACWRLQRRAESLAALARAAALSPEDAALSALLAERTAHFPRLRERALAINHALDQDAERWVNAALAAERRQEHDAARTALAQALRRDPTHPIARHLHDALTGAPSRQPPPGYVERLFDAYAETFDTHLVGTLGYRLPELLAARVPDGVEAVLDLGCGTGLLSAWLRDRVSWLVGVDLSAGMLARCAAGGQYDALFQADAVQWLEEAATDLFFDLIVVADVLIYVGDAGPLLAAAARRLAPGGQVLLSVEAVDEADAGSTGLCLTGSGRYAHSDTHIREAAQAAGLRVVTAEATRIRQGQGASGWEEGTVYTLQADRDGGPEEA